MRDEEEELGTKELKHLLYTLPVDKPLGPEIDQKSTSRTATASCQLRRGEGNQLFLFCLTGQNIMKPNLDELQDRSDSAPPGLDSPLTYLTRVGRSLSRCA